MNVSKNDELPASHGQRNARWAWALGGAVYGVLIRFVMGALPASTYNAMSVAFLIGTPLAVGAIAAYGSPKARQSVLGAAGAPMAPMALMMLGCAVTLLEGSICIAIMAPLFFGLAAFGGLIMGLALRIAGAGKPTLCVAAVLPVLLIPAQPAALPDTFHELRESAVVQAEPAVVWQQIVSAKQIRADELPGSLVHAIGVPRPVYAENRATPDGEQRTSRWEKGVHFTATIVERRDRESITWRYAFAPDSFPAGTMDDHVVLGGRYLDLGDTTFNLQALPGGRTRLEIVGRYRLSTPINGYAVPMSKLLGRDFLQMLLGFYKGRAERAEGAV